MPTDEPIAYVIGSYPLLTTTFIDREIEEMERLGDVVIVSLRRPTGRPLSPDQQAASDRVRYVRPATAMRVFVAHLRFLLTRPVSLLAAYFSLPFRSHPRLIDRMKTIGHVGLGVVVADELRPVRVRHLHAHFIDRAATVVWVASRLLGIPYSVTAHANDIYVAPVMLGRKVSDAAFVATCTEYNRSFLESVVPSSTKVVAIHHGIALSGFPEPLTRESPPIVLAVGQLKEKKGLRYLIEAAAEIADRAFRLVIVGDGPLRSDLERLTGEVGMRDRVLLTGALSHPEVISWMQRSSIFALPSVVATDGDRDGIPNVILEAMAMELPVVSTRHSGIPEAVEDRTTGLLVEPTDVSGLAEALAALLDDPGLRERMGVAGRARVADKFDLGTNVAALRGLMVP